MDLDVCLVGWFCLVGFFSCVNQGIRREAASHLSSQVQCSLQLDSNAEVVLMETSPFSPSLRDEGSPTKPLP